MHSVDEIVFEHIVLRHGTLFTPASQPCNVVPKSFHSISSLQTETVLMFPPLDGHPVSKILKLRGNNQFEGFFLSFFGGGVCFLLMYVFLSLLNKRCLILEAISDRFYLRKIL